MPALLRCLGLSIDSIQKKLLVDAQLHVHFKSPARVAAGAQQRCGVPYRKVLLRGDAATEMALFKASMYAGLPAHQNPK